MDYFAEILLIWYNLNEVMAVKHDKNYAVELINKKINNETFLSYKEIAQITGYHEKYISKLKKQIMSGTITIEHGNKNRRPVNALTREESQMIIKLYKQSHVSLRKFCKFYGKRSYSCIYNLLKKNSLLKKGDIK